MAKPNDTSNPEVTESSPRFVPLCSGLLIPDTDLGENPRRERGV
ncbi:hypothetical protein PALA51_01422 [Pseudomonas aeruginosa]|nr:hypothetical protein Q023_05994 [Pseudomonas aeruginosa BWHPSA010]RCM53300.1 hypothetical protein PA157_00448 [Pseudomonas aeruginosa]WBI91596.1 hypothetical protein PALA51_01422 [Pseudomonas aeruginosa]